MRKINLKHNLLGMKFNKLMPIKYVGKSSWLCKCDCGNECVVQSTKLIKNQTKSCGCYKAINMRNKMKQYNEYYIVDDITYIRYRNTDDCFIIDTEDLDKIKKYCWYNDNGYPRTHTNKGKCVRLHSMIMNNRKGLVIDHINGNRWDNRKCNLRICSYQMNAINTRRNNTSPYPTGIKLVESGKYVATITYNYKVIYLGSYDKIEDAIKVREQAEIKYFGEKVPSKKITIDLLEKEGV